jgi:hypothetical protein
MLKGVYMLKLGFSRERIFSKRTSILMLVVLLILLALACDNPIASQSSKETKVVESVQLTLLSDKVSTVEAQQTSMAKTNTGKATEGETSPTTEVPPTPEATSNNQQPTTLTATSVPPSQTPVPSATPVTIRQWKNAYIIQTSNGCHSATSCWVGASDGYSHDIILLADETVFVDPNWDNPYLVFWHTYKVGDKLSASVAIRVDGSWVQLVSYRPGFQDWEQVALDLNPYKGKDITLRFSAKDGAAIDIYRSGWHDQAPGPISKWSLEEIQIIPDYQP